MKLKRFNKDKSLNQLHNKINKDTKIKKRTVILSILILTLSIIYFTYAIYESKSSEFTIINATVGDFSGDIKIISYNYDDGSGTVASHSTPPAKHTGKVIDNVNCENAKGEWLSDDWGVKITNITGNVKCTLTFRNIETTSDLIAGDVVYYNTNGNEGPISSWTVGVEGTEPILVSTTTSPNSFTIAAGENNYNNLYNLLNAEAASYSIDNNYIQSISHIRGIAVLTYNKGQTPDINDFPELKEFCDGQSNTSCFIAKKPNGEPTAYWSGSNYHYQSDWLCMSNCTEKYYALYIDANGTFQDVVLYGKSDTTTVATSSGSFPIRLKIKLQPTVTFEYDDSLNALVMTGY